MSRLLHPVLLALTVLFLAGCSPAAVAPAADAGTSGSAPASVPATWTGEGLLPAAGGMTRVGEIGVYFAVDVFRYTVVGVDVTTGAELWRQPVDQHGRIRGVVEQPTVDPGTGLVLAGRVQDGLPRLAAFDLRTGTERWTVPSVWMRSTPRLCGTSSVCVLGEEGTVVTHTRSDGTVTATGQALGVDLGGGGDRIVTSDPDRGLVELGRLADAGYERVWRRGTAELTGTGTAHSSDGGWQVRVDAADGSAVVSLGVAPDEGDRDGDTALAREPAVGWATAFLTPAGDVLERVTGLVPCFGLPVSAEGVPLCRVVETRLDQADSLLRLVDRVEVRTAAGAPLWARDLPVPVDLDQVTPSAVPGTVALPTPGGRLVLDRGTGAPAGPAPDGLVLCTPPLAGVDLYVGLSGPAGRIVEYLRIDPADLAVPCSPAGELVPVTEVLAAGRPLPEGTGPAEVAAGAPPSAADSWVVTVTPDGVLQGAGPPP